MGFLSGENDGRICLLSILNFYANPYNSHNFQFHKKQPSTNYIIFLANVFSACFFCDQPFGQPISYAFLFFVMA